MDYVEEMLKELRDVWKEALGENEHSGSNAYNAYKEEKQGEKTPLEIFDKLNLTR